MFACVNFFGKSSSSESSTNQIPRVSNHFCGRTVKKISTHSQAFIQRVCEIFRKTLRGISLYLPFSERRRGLKLPKDKNLASKVIKDWLIKAPDAKNLKIFGLVHPIPRFILESCCDKYSTLPVSKLTSEKEIHFSDGRFRINGFWRMTLEEIENSFGKLWKIDPIAIKGNCLKEFNDFLNDLNDFKSNKGSSLLTEKNVLSIFYLSKCIKLPKLKEQCIEFLEHSVKLDINFIRNHELDFVQL